MKLENDNLKTESNHVNLEGTLNLSNNNCAVSYLLSNPIFFGSSEWLYKKFTNKNRKIGAFFNFIVFENEKKMQTMLKIKN